MLGEEQQSSKIHKYDMISRTQTVLKITCMRGMIRQSENKWNVHILNKHDCRRSMYVRLHLLNWEHRPPRVWSNMKTSNCHRNLLRLQRG